MRAYINIETSEIMKRFYTNFRFILRKSKQGAPKGSLVEGWFSTKWGIKIMLVNIFINQKKAHPHRSEKRFMKGLELDILDTIIHEYFHLCMYEIFTGKKLTAAQSWIDSNMIYTVIEEIVEETEV